MKTFESITGYKPRIYDGRIITFGLTVEEISYLKVLLNNSNIELYDADIASDLVALFATAIIVNSSKLEPDDFNLLENYYKEVGTEAEEKVFWLGSPLPSMELQLLFNCFSDFDSMLPAFKNVLSTISRH
ncbi:MAG: hypothetical protein Q4A54_01690 [Parabacteroides sp.]|nr:hypothetical protein [Parabacteroides sp.]